MRLRFVLTMAFIVVPIVELVILVAVGRRIGVLPTIAIVIVTAVLGSYLVVHQGRTTWVRIRRELAAGDIPAAAAVDGALILVAGALMLTPGMLTDAAGFALLVPPVREWIRRLVAGRYRRRWTTTP